MSLKWLLNKRTCKWSGIQKSTYKTTMFSAFLMHWWPFFHSNALGLLLLPEFLQSANNSSRGKTVSSSWRFIVLLYLNQTNKTTQRNYQRLLKNRVVIQEVYGFTESNKLVWSFATCNIFYHLYIHFLETQPRRLHQCRGFLGHSFTTILSQQASSQTTWKDQGNVKETTWRARGRGWIHFFGLYLTNIFLRE